MLAASCDPAHIPLIPEETDISIQNVLFRATVFCEEPEIWVANYYFIFAQAVATLACCVFLFVCQQLGR
ncbi:protein of unknown function (plasmid) [Cupriavidus taiwanensis]|nr:protein of unknown function [Cupriavidus taiwanensis]